MICFSIIVGRRWREGMFINMPPPLMAELPPPTTSGSEGNAAVISIRDRRKLAKVPQV